MALTLPLQPAPDDDAHFLASAKHYPHLLLLEDPIRQRIIMERAVVRRMATDLLAKGYQLRVFYGIEEGYGCDRTDDVSVVMAAIQACDEEYVYVYAPVPEAGWRRVSSVFLVYGNDGWDVINDHGMSIADDMKGVDAFTDELADAASATNGYGNGGAASRRAEDGCAGA